MTNVSDELVAQAWGHYNHPEDDEPEEAELEAMRAALSAVLPVIERPWREKINDLWGDLNSEKIERDEAEAALETARANHSRVADELRSRLSQAESLNAGSKDARLLLAYQDRAQRAERLLVERDQEIGRLAHNKTVLWQKLNDAEDQLVERDQEIKGLKSDVQALLAAAKSRRDAFESARKKLEQEQ